MNRQSFLRNVELQVQRGLELIFLQECVKGGMELNLPVYAEVQNAVLQFVYHVAAMTEEELSLSPSKCSLLRSNADALRTVERKTLALLGPVETLRRAQFHLK